MKKDNLSETFILANAGAPFGLDGFIKIKSLSGLTSHLALLKEAVLRKNGIEKRFTVEKTGFLDNTDTLLMKFNGINSPEEARQLAGSELIATRSMAAPLNEGEFYIEDLKGLEVLSGDPNDESGQNIVMGRITDIVEGGGGELAEIRLISGECKFVPFRKEFFGNIDIENRTIMLREKWILEL